MNSIKNKQVTVSLQLSDIKKNRAYYNLPGDEDLDNNIIKNAVSQRYATEHGRMEFEIGDSSLIITWTPETVSKEGEAYHFAAVEFTKQKMFDKAIRTWKKALDDNGFDVDYLYKLSILYFERKKYSESILNLEKVIGICPIHSKALLLLGINWIKLRKFDKAENYVIDSLHLNSSNILTYLNLGAIYSVKKDFDKSIEMYSKCIELSSKEARAYLGLARIYNMMNDHGKANNHFKRVIELAPDTRMAEYANRSLHFEKPKQAIGEANTGNNPKHASREDLFSYGMGQYLTGQYKKSADQYKSYLQTHPSDDYGWYLLGETLLRTGEIEESADCIKRAIRLNGKRGLYYKTLGLSLNYLGKSKETVQVLKKAIELGKRDALCLTIHGINLMYEQRIEDGMKFLEKSMHKNPNNPLAMYNLALGYIKFNQQEKAKKLINRLLKFDYFLPLKDQARKLLTTIQ